MEDALRSHLLICAQTYCDVTGLARSTLGRKVASDPRFFRNIATEATFTARKYDLVMAWFSANWPEGLAWPTDVPRPTQPVVDAMTGTAAAGDPPPAAAFCAGGVSERPVHVDSS